jgi:hypothetical protein
MERAMKLDDEERKWLAGILKKAGIKAAPFAFDKFMYVSSSIQAFRASTSMRRGTHREAHDAIRKLFFKAHEDNCAPDEIVELVDELPEQAVGYIDRRATLVIPKLFPGETADNGFRQWARTASRTELIVAAQVLSSEGASLVDRSRGTGKRSGKRVEPVVMGLARGAGGHKHKGGRPKDEPMAVLIAQSRLGLALTHRRAPCHRA